MLRIHPEARKEFQRATAYYSKISKGLAKRFVLEIEGAFVKVLENPKLYPIHSEDARAKLLHDFPYSIIYLIEKYYSPFTRSIISCVNPAVRRFSSLAMALCMRCRSSVVMPILLYPPS